MAQCHEDAGPTSKAFADLRDATWQQGAALFRTFDTNENGHLDMSELSALCEEKHGQAPDHVALLTMIEALDTDGDGNVGLEEFLWWFRHDLSLDALRDRSGADQALAARQEQERAEQQQQQRKQQLATSANGGSSYEGSAAGRLPEHISPALLQALASRTVRLLHRFALWDEDEDGAVNLHEFERACMSLNVTGLHEADVRFEELVALKATLERWDAERGARGERCARGGHGREERLGGAGEAALPPPSGRRQLLWRYVKETALGAVWKQPLKPHHALDLEPYQPPSALHERQPPRRRYAYHAGPVPAVAEHCEGTMLLLQDAASDAVWELGGLLGEVRQASLKAEEMRLAQRADAAAGPARDALQRHELFLESFAYSLEAALIMLERYGRARRAGAVKNAAVVAEAGRRSHAAAAADAAAAAEGQQPLKLARASQKPKDARDRAALLIQTMARGQLARTEVLRIRVRARRPAAHGLAGKPLARYLDKFAPRQGQVRFLGKVSRAYTLLLAIYFALALTAHAIDAHFSARRREACEFHAYACAVRPEVYACSAEGDLSLRNNGSGCVAGGDELSWGHRWLDERCEPGALPTSWLKVVPLSLLFALSLLPVLLWRHNSSFSMWYKLVCETPSVPLIVIQCTLRALVLSLAAADSHDRVFSALEAAQEWSLLVQVVVFIFMDTMTRPAPKLRVFFAVVLLARFVASFYTRSFGRRVPAEQYPLLPQGGAFEGIGAAGVSTRQSVVASIDWTVVAMMAVSISSVILHPRELAFVRLRCDVLSYINWRDHFVRRMMVRGNRRHEDLEDALLFTREKTRRLLRAGKLAATSTSAAAATAPSGRSADEGVQRV